MPIVDHAARLITCNLVYYGPEQSGKTTNLTWLHAALPPGQVGPLTSVSTRRDRRLQLDYLPADVAVVGGYRLCVQLQTAPGQPRAGGLVPQLLHGADGVAFIADSQVARVEANLESLADLHAGLAQLGVDARTLPLVLQYNKQQLPVGTIVPPHRLSAVLNFRGVPECAADARAGQGVLETVQRLLDAVLRRHGMDRISPVTSHAA
jgi:signal recognition particle receptor subunit beta